MHTLADIIRFRLLMIAAGYAGVVQPSDVRTSKRGHLLVAQRREEGMIQEPPIVASGPFLPLGLDVLDQPLFGDPHVLLAHPCWPNVHPGAVLPDRRRPGLAGAPARVSTARRARRW